MIRSRSKKVILVAPEIFPEQLIRGYSNLKQINAIVSLFPSIYEFNPDLIIIDHDYVGAKDVEKTLRRIRSNKFYDKIRIHCFKADRNEKTDSLLKVLGVEQFIYREDLLKSQKQHGVLNSVNSIIDNSIMAFTASVSN
ncbi:MAG TPA: hypothetical protein VFE53_19200 [Mucilaginibacter sp.]|jgi:hypothetical protein|nr:hypothetical protein [Mucilaginibacter sp.]